MSTSVDNATILNATHNLNESLQTQSSDLAWFLIGLVALLYETF